MEKWNTSCQMVSFSNNTKTHSGYKREVKYLIVLLVKNIAGCKCMQVDTSRVVLTKSHRHADSFMHSYTFYVSIRLFIFFYPLSLFTSPYPSNFFYPANTATITQSHTQPEAFTDLFMHFSCTLVCLLLSFHTGNHASPHSLTQTHTVGCWKPATIVDPLVAKWI